MNKEIKKFIEQNKNAEFPKGTCCEKHYCRDCRHLETDNDAWNDGTRRCAERSRWVRPSDIACPRFSY